MASHVVVMDSTARRATVKTTPGTYLSDVLSEACNKLSASSTSQWGLKHNNKQIDLSRTIRLSGLSSGAKLELVQLSKSAGVVSVALQLPASEASNPSQARLTDKFPSTTTLWLLLRKFEAGVAGTGSSTTKRNLTARGAPSLGGGSSGAGRLYYEQPVLNVMGRELSVFTDLQKSLAQLGLNSGNVLIKLDFRVTQTPLEEAMTQIQSYFDSVDASQTEPAKPEIAKDDMMKNDIAAALASMDDGSVVEEQKQEEQKQSIQPEWLEDKEMIDAPAETSLTQGTSQNTHTTTSIPSADSQANPPLESITPSTTTIGSHTVSIYRPPTTSTPTTYNEADYVPTVEHAQAHQKLLQTESRNRRLPTDAEIAQKEQEQAEQLKQITKVDIRVRFPDLTFVDGTFTQSSTAADLHGVVRDCLRTDLREQAFMLRNPGMKGKDELIQDSAQKKLITDLKLRGKVLVVFSWSESASPAAKQEKNVLKPELRSQAQEYRPPPVPGVVEDVREDAKPPVNLGKKPDASSSSEGAGKKIPKWLMKGLGKK